MKLIFLIPFTAAVFSTANLGAQARPVSQRSPKPTMTNAADSLKMAMSDAKNSFNTLFKGHKDTTTITIAGIDYDDANLSVLKDDLKKMKGIKSVSTQFQSNTITLKVPFKGKPTDLWDNLPASAKTPFKVIEATDNNIVLGYVNKSAK